MMCVVLDIFQVLCCGKTTTISFQINLFMWIGRYPHVPKNKNIMYLRGVGRSKKWCSKPLYLHFY